MRILFLSAWYPYPSDNGSKLRIYSMLRGLAQHHDVTLVTFADHMLTNHPSELTEICRRIVVVPFRSYRSSSARAVLGLLNPKPRAVVDTYAPEMARAILAELARERYDLIIASQWPTAAYSRYFGRTPAIFEEIELGVFEAKKASSPTPLHRFRHTLTLVKLRHYLRRLLPRFAACTVVSQVEADLLRRLVPGYHPIEVIPNGVDMESCVGTWRAPQPNTMIFAGSLGYYANHDAMAWFISRVLPRIQRTVPSAHLTITGAPGSLPLPAAKQVSLTGYVDDVRPLIASSWLSLAPLRLGGGTRLKILEAMALRTPVVATSKGAEGLAVRHDEHLLIADTPESFANEVIHLLTDAALRDRLSKRGMSLLREKYDWSVIMPKLLNLSESVSQGNKFRSNLERAGVPK